jgi:hypothetical protein
MENEEHSTTVTVLSHAHIARVGNSYVPLKITYQEEDAVVADGTTAVIGSDAESTVRIVRPGISRRHAVVSQSPSGWVIEDAGSRNGSYRFGLRFDRVEINGPETVYLGHPTDGEELTLAPVDAGGASSASDAPVVETFVLPESPPVKTGAAAATGTAAGKTVPKTKAPAGSSTATASAKDAKPPVSAAAPPPAVMAPETSAARSRAQRTPREVDLADLTNALRDQINAVKGLTWSVWAMIAVTAALAVMTLFVGILGS